MAYHLSHWSISTQVDPYVWRPDGVRMPGWPLHKFGDLRDIPFLGPDGGLPWTEWNTAFGSAPDETNKYDRMSRSFALAWEIWDRLPNDPSIHEDVREAYERRARRVFSVWHMASPRLQLCYLSVRMRC